MTQDSRLLTAEQVQAIAAPHVPVPCCCNPNHGEHCAYCKGRWPCQTKRLADHAGRELLEAAEEMALVLGEVCKYGDSYRGMHYVNAKKALARWSAVRGRGAGVRGLWQALLCWLSIHDLQATYVIHPGVAYCPKCHQYYRY